MTDLEDQWRGYGEALSRWHADRERSGLSEALAAIRRAAGEWFPAGARRRWSAAAREDAVSGFIERLLEKPLPTPVAASAKAYLRESFRNHCLSLERHDRARPAHLSDDPEQATIASAYADAAERARSVENERIESLAREEIIAAFERLAQDDSIALKLLVAPDRLSHAELEELARRNRIPIHELLSRLHAANTSYDLTLLLDPPAGNESADQEARRKRLERFRRRCNRARDTLHRLLGERP
jgi:hypothetical protein